MEGAPADKRRRHIVAAMVNMAATRGEGSVARASSAEDQSGYCRGDRVSARSAGLLFSEARRLSEMPASRSSGCRRRVSSCPPTRLPDAPAEARSAQAGRGTASQRRS